MNINQEMGRDHRQIEDTLRQLNLAVDAGDFAGIQRLLAEADARLRQHLAAEERCLLDRFEHEHADTAKALRAQHTEILAELDRLCVAADLHTLRKASVDAFIAQLQAHMAQEQASLYPWAQDLEESARHGLLAFLREYAPFAADPPASGS